MIAIYALIDPMSQELRYVGLTTNPTQRLRAHIRGSNRRPRVTHWVQSLVQRGIYPDQEIIEWVADAASANEAERFWIGYFRFIGCELTNLTSGGEGLRDYHPTKETRAKLVAKLTGRPVSSETRARLRAIHLGRKFPPLTAEQLARHRKFQVGHLVSAETRAKLRAANLGKKASAETRAKIGEASRGITRVFTAEHRANLSRAARGRKWAMPFTAEHRAKLSAAHLGKKRGPYQKRAVA